MNLTHDHSRVAVYSPENTYLSKYLGARDLDLSRYIYAFLGWGKSKEILKRAGVSGYDLKRLQEEGDDQFYELCDQILKVMSNDEKEKFVVQMVDNTQDDPTTVPSWGAHGSESPTPTT